MTHAPIAIVLPPGEGFSPVETGAVGLVARHHAIMADRPVIVLGREQPGPTFGGIAYRPITPARFAPRVGRYAAGLVRDLKDIRPALIEVHNRPDIAAALARRFPGLPIALFLHNDPRRMRGLRSPRARARVLRRLAAIVCVSDHIASRMAVPGAPLPVVLPNPIDLRDIPPPDPPAGLRAGLLFAGRAVADKGADLFVAAVARAALDPATWPATLVGADRFSANSPDTPYLRALRPAARDAGVRLAGHQDRARVLHALAHAAIAIVPSRWEEPFGLAALEALACGTPLIVTRRGGLPEVVADAALIVDATAEALADAIRALAADPARRAALSDAGRARARRFDLPALAPRLNALRALWLAPS